MSGFSARALFEQLDEKEFPTYDDLEEAVIEQFREQIRETPAPPGYSYLDALELAHQYGWIHSLGHGRYSVGLKAVPIQGGD